MIEEFLKDVSGAFIPLVFADMQMLWIPVPKEDDPVVIAEGDVFFRDGKGLGCVFEQDPRQEFRYVLSPVHTKERLCSFVEWARWRLLDIRYPALHAAFAEKQVRDWDGATFPKKAEAR